VISGQPLEEPEEDKKSVPNDATAHEPVSNIENVPPVIHPPVDEDSTVSNKTEQKSQIELADQGPPIDATGESDPEEQYFRCGEKDCDFVGLGGPKLFEHFSEHYSKDCSTCCTHFRGPVDSSIHRALYPKHILTDIQDMMSRAMATEPPRKKKPKKKHRKRGKPKKNEAESGHDDRESPQEPNQNEVASDHEDQSPKVPYQSQFQFNHDECNHVRCWTKDTEEHRFDVLKQIIDLLPTVRIGPALHKPAVAAAQNIFNKGVI